MNSLKLKFIFLIFITISTSVFSGSRFVFISGLTLCLILTISSLINKKISFRIQDLYLIIILFLILITNGFDSIINSLSLCSVIFICYIVTNSLTKSNNVGAALFDVVLLINIHSLVGFIFQFIVDINEIKYIDIFGFKGHSFIYLFYYRAYDEFFEIYRSQGIFSEPGIAQLFYNILFMYALKEKASTKHVIISSFNVITSLSVTGYIIYIVLLVNASKYRIYIGISLCFIFIAMGLYSDLSLYIGKSTYLRAYDTLKSYNIFLNYPMLGIGLNTDAYTSFYYFNQNLYGIILDSDISRNGVNSVTKVFAQLGFFGGLFVIILLFRKKYFFPFTLNWILFITALAQPVLLSPFYLFILSLGFFRSVKVPVSKINYFSGGSFKTNHLK